MDPFNNLFGRNQENNGIDTGRTYNSEYPKPVLGYWKIRGLAS